jgi:putative ABC transport system permease protein
MRWISEIVFRLRATLFPGRMEREMEEEMAFHLEMEARKLLQRGMTPEDAMKQARRNFGEPMRHKERTRESWGITMILNLRNDVRLTLRSLRRNPVFTAVAILTLALGIGANTAIFSVVNGVLLRSLPFPRADRIVFLCEVRPDEARSCHTASPPNVADWADQSGSFEALGVFRWWPFMLGTPEGNRSVAATIATPGLMDVLGFQPVLGRLLQPEDQAEGRRNVVVLTYDFWQSRFGGDPGIVGTTLDLDGAPFEVVGILQEGNEPPSLQPGITQIWTPLHIDPRDEGHRKWRGFYALGRLAPGVSLSGARQELESVRAGLAEQHPETNAEWGLQLTTLQDRVVGSVRTTLLFFLGAVGLVLLITCANIANLILARMSSRERELGIRAALGANSRRLAGLLLAEGLVLASLGACVGLLLARFLTPIFIALAPPGIPRLGEVELDATVLAFALGLTVLATLLFGLTPLARGSLLQPTRALKGSRQGGASGRLGGLNGGLVVTEVALALALLVGAGLLTRSFTSFQRWDPGFDTDNLLVFQAFLPTAKYQDSEAVLGLLNTLQSELEALPGVQAVGRASAGPLFGGWEPDLIHPGEAPGSEGSGRPVRWYDISPGYFEALGVPVVAGRDLLPDDGPGAPRVAIVNRTLADRLWPGESVLGKSVWLEEDQISRMVVGVVEDVPPFNPDASVEPEIFWPQAQHTRSVSYFVVRTAGDPSLLTRPITDRLLQVEPDVQAGRPVTYGEMMGRHLVVPRFNMLLTGVFSAVAFLLAALGIYGVVSRSVTARTRETGIRVALGAQRLRVVRDVVEGSLVLAGVGVAVGIALALGLSRFMGSMLHGVSPTDPLTYVTVAAALFMVAVLASLIPATAASRVDAMVSLREE